MTKIGVIGLDGMSRKYLNKLINSGAMPYTKHLINKSSIIADLYAFPPVTPVSWPSIMSGVSPAVHGIYDFFVYKDNGTVRLSTSYDLEHPRIHEMLSFMNKSSIIINPIPSYPIIPVKNSYILSLEFFTPKPTYYPEEMSKYVKIFSDYKVGVVSSLNEMFKKAESHMMGYIEIVEDLINKKDFDLLWINLHYPDAIFHKANKNKIYDILEKVYPEEMNLYRIVDNMIRIIDSSVDDLIIVSDHGFAKYNKYISINTLLKANGLVVPILHGVTSLRENVFRNKVQMEPKDETTIKYNRIIRVLRNPLIRPIAKKFKEIYEKITGRKVKIIYPDVDPINSVAFLFSRSSFGIFVRNRAIEDKIVEILKDIEGIKYVWKKHDLFKGPYLDRLPNIYVYPDFDNGYTIADTKIYENIVTRTIGLDHHPLGIFIVKNGCGEKVPIGSILPNTIPAPLIQLMLDLPISEFVEERKLLLDICRKELKTTDIYYRRWKVLKRLKALKRNKLSGID